MAARRREKVRGSGRKPREARRDALAAQSLFGPSPFLGTTSSSFFVRFCKVFLAGILPRDSAGAPAPPPSPPPLRPDSSATVRYHIYLPLRCFVFCRPSLTYTLGCSLLSSNLFPTSFSPLLAVVYPPLCVCAMAVTAATKTTAAAAGGGAFPSSKLRNSNEISGKVNILCVNQIPTSIREDPWHGAVKFNSTVALHGCIHTVVLLPVPLISLLRTIPSPSPRLFLTPAYISFLSRMHSISHT